MDHLPQTVRLILSRDPPANINALAVATTPQLQPSTLTTQQVSSNDSDLHTTGSAEIITKAQKDNNDKQLCYYHNKFGKKATQCRPVNGAPCSMKHLLKSMKTITPPPTADEVNNDGKKTLTLSDVKSGANYLVVSGADVSCIPASAADQDPHQSNLQLVGRYYVITLSPFGKDSNMVVWTITS
jgi:hypothetical protein